MATNKVVAEMSITEMLKLRELSGDFHNLVETLEELLQKIDNTPANYSRSFRDTENHAADLLESIRRNGTGLNVLTRLASYDEEEYKGYIKEK